MTIPRFVFGKRPDNQFGVFISPPGVDASTALAAQLSLHITSATAQLAMQGVVAAPFPSVVPHALGYVPVIFPNLISTGLITGFGYVRPFDNGWGPWLNSRVKSEATQFTFEQTKNGAATDLPINYFAFARSIS